MKILEEQEKEKPWLKKDLPHSMESFKKRAKKFAREYGYIHMEGLDAYSRYMGFEDFHKARVFYEGLRNENT